ncbi:hypothetical protein [Pseudoalteromonas ulvae]|uniref:ABM domain-containing protein n=1 Tax=Pseudoalteromonas ulvae TaxID=107327 RepID=A0A244CLK5_PSEDV|nr:hypothetical protein [Pseudoalteromonas ulvae]OUL56497.1 hypothetical protein B1199_17700 [Pseudoalteromonas ulvae]
MSTNAIEIVQFTLKQSADLAQFEQANSAFQQFIDQQPGVLYRSLATHPDTAQYVDVVYFETMADAKRIGDAFMKHPICQQFLQLIEKDSVTLARYNAVSQTPCEQSA